MKSYTTIPLKIQLFSVLRNVFFRLFPINTKRYQIAHTLLRNFLIHFRPLNVQYQRWLKIHDSLSKDEIARLTHIADALENKPIISIIMPVFNPKVKHLEQAIQSVLDQTYSNWELCIADDASTNPEVKETIQAYNKTDSRIKTVFREINGHISAASNSAFELASGDFVALVDHDDVLHPLALYWVVRMVNQYPDSEVIFSDEDKILSSGKRIEPYFKSDFDEELFLSQNMVSHLGVYKTKTIREIGGFRVGLEGSQDYDLMLRVLEIVDPKKIQHIPRVLYHWRISRQSAAENVDVKPYALTAGKQALTEYLNNQNIKATVEPYQKYGYKIRYQMLETKPSIEVFLNNISGSNTIDSVRSLLTSTNYENLKVNWFSMSEETKGQLDDFYDNRLRIVANNNIHQDENSINRRVSLSNADLILLLHQHCTDFSKYWLEELLGLVFKPGIGAVSPQLVFSNGLIFSSGIILGAEMLARHVFHGIPKSGPDLYFGWSSLDKGYSALPPGCLLVKRKSFLAVEGFNLSLSTETAQTIDFCLKLREIGLRNVMVPSTLVTQRVSDRTDFSSKDLIQNPIDREYFLNRWSNWFVNDPAFNPNLTVIQGKPAISKSPRIDYQITTQ